MNDQELREDREAAVAALGDDDPVVRGVAEALYDHDWSLTATGAIDAAKAVLTYLAAHPDLASKVAAAVPGARATTVDYAERLRSLPAHAQYPTTAAGRRLLGKNMGNGDMAAAEWLANDIWAIESEARAAIPGPAPDERGTPD